MKLAFEELWEPRSVDTGVSGFVTTAILASTSDGSDPQQPWTSNSITGRWGTLAGLNSSVMDVTGLGPNKWWSVNGEQLSFHSENIKTTTLETGGFPLISKQAFSRNSKITVEAKISMTAGTPGAFIGLALIAGEGDYREIAFRKENGKLYIKRNTPLRETVLAEAASPTSTFRMEYDPVTGFRYLADDILLGTEAIDHERADFSQDPQVALYFVSERSIPDPFVEGSVGPVRVWVEQPGKN
jgi:hypothetical protein